MRGTQTSDPRSWHDAVLGAALFAVDPAAIGGLRVMAMAGPVRDRWLNLLRQFFQPDMPLRPVPLQVGDDRLLGGLDLAATLHAGRPVAERGILAEADGGAVLLAMAERIAPSTAAQLAQVLDCLEVAVERDGIALRESARIGVIALDEGVDADEAPPPVLLDRLGLFLDLTALGVRDLVDVPLPPGSVIRARELLPSVTVSDALLRAFCASAAAFGISSLRVPMFALRAARAVAALDGRNTVTEADAAAAVRLVIAPRAVALPETAERLVDPSLYHGAGGRQPHERDSETSDRAAGKDRNRDAAPDQSIEEILVSAAQAAIPTGLLSRLRAGNRGRASPRASGRVGTPQCALRRGRPVGARRGRLTAGGRLHLVETLRAAAPWQRLRQRDPGPGWSAPRRIAVRPEDFHIVLFKERSRTVTIFVVDASGSTALNRLSEAKGAVELLLADCYVRRDQVALLAFRGARAELILPPTRSLARAKRSLAGLPGGGGTPLAAALDAAAALATAVQRRGETPTIVLLTDGRANIARDGTVGRQRADEDALLAARRLRLSAFPTLLCDVSRRPQPHAEILAAAMDARYLRLPDANASILSEAVRSATAR